MLFSPKKVYLEAKIDRFLSSFNQLFSAEAIMYTANVCRDLQGLCGEIGVRGFQIYRDWMYTCNPRKFEIPAL